MKTSDRIRRSMAAQLSIPLLAMATVCGCASSSALQSESPDYVGLYESGHYATAYRSAQAAASDQSARSVDQPSLIAGLSAHAMGHYKDAEMWLTPLVQNQDPEISGRAAAALGLIEKDRKQYDKAASHLSLAATRLEGNEAARAGLHAGDCFALLGRPEAARIQYNLARTAATDESVWKALDERLARAEYTVQLGAYSTLANAERAVMSTSRIARRLGLGDPFITEDVASTGQRVYIVQVGTFRTRNDADQARLRLGPDTIVASVPIE